MLDDSTLSVKELLEIRRERYERTKSMFCPFLKEEVFFNSRGIYHATHDGRGKIRKEADSRMRLHLLPWIYRVIKKSRHFGEPIRVIPKSDPSNDTGKEIEFYELCWQFNPNKTVSVILRRIGKGNLHYFSVRYTKKQNRPR